MIKKIAFPTDDGMTISAHLGETQFFLVATLNDDGSFITELRKKPIHRHEHHNGHAHSAHDEHLQDDDLAHGPSRAHKMLAVIDDCQTLISRGMGQPAYNHALASGMEVLLVAEKNISAALEAYRARTLVSDLRRVHK